MLKIYAIAAFSHDHGSDFFLVADLFVSDTGSGDEIFIWNVVHGLDDALVVINHGIDVVGKGDCGVHVDLEVWPIPFALASFILSLHDGFVEWDSGFDSLIIIIGFDGERGKHFFSDLVSSVVGVGQRLDMHVWTLLLRHYGGVGSLVEWSLGEVKVFFHV